MNRLILNLALIAAISALSPLLAGAQESARKAWDEAEKDGDPAKYEAIIRQFPNELDEYAGSYWPEKRSIRFADNARIHLLNQYVDWKHKNKPKDIPKAKALAAKVLALPSRCFAVDRYTGYTRPHTLMILASLADDNQTRAKYYIRVAQEHWGDIGGHLFKDGGYQYGPAAKYKLGEIVGALPESDQLRKSIEKVLSKLPEVRPSNQGIERPAPP